MPLRRVTGRAKKNKGIYEYFRAADTDKALVSYYYSFTDATGKTLKVNANTKKLQDAINLKAEAELRVKQEKELSATDGQKQDYTLDQFAEIYFSSREKRANLTKDSQRYKNHISGTFGKKLISDITTDQIKRFRNDLDLAESSITNVMILFQSIMNYADLTEHRTRRPFRGIKVSKKRDGRKRILSNREIDRLMKAAQKLDDRLYMMLLMLLYTAQRPKSILSLKVSDIDLHKREIGLEEIKGQEARFIPIADKLYDPLAQWIEAKDPGESLIGIGYDRMVELTGEVFKPFNKDLDYKTDRHKWASMYSMRHTAATRILKNTGNIKLAKEILGHSDLKMTEIYAQLANEEKKAGVNAI